MADNLLRLRVDSQEYDSKLERAAEGLQRYVNGCRKAGATLEYLDDGVLEYVKSLGKMESESVSAKEKLNEMSKAFVDLRMQYKNLTDAERSTPFGKALASGLDQLRGRIKETRKELKNVDSELNGGFLGGKLNGMLQVFGGNIMTKAAGWAASLGREVVSVVNKSTELAKSAEGVQVAFAKLGRSDLLAGLREATNNTVSDFELMKSAVNLSTDQINERMKQTGDMTKAIVELIREETEKANEFIGATEQKSKQATAELENAMLDLGNAMRETFGFSGWDDMATSIKSKLVPVLTTVVNLIDGIKVSFNNIISDTKSLPTGIGIYNALPERVRVPAEQLAALQGSSDRKGLYNKTVSQYDLRIADQQARVRALGTSSLIPEIQATIDSEQKKLQELQSMRSTYISRAQSILKESPARKVGGGGGGKVKLPAEELEYIRLSQVLGDLRRTQRAENLWPVVARPDEIGGGATSMKELQADLRYFKDLLANARTQGEYTRASRGIAETQGRIGAQPMALEMGISIPEAEIMMQAATLKEELEGYFKDNPLQINLGEDFTREGKAAKDSWKSAAQAVSSVGSAMQSIENPAAKIAGIVAQSIATVAAAYADALMKDVPSKSNIFSFIAAAAAATISMATTIASIHSATGYERGGVVGGNSYSGDNVGPVFLNSGEVVLTRAMAANVANMLTEGQRGGFDNSMPYVTGEKIVLGINNWGKRYGKGELVFSRN